MRRSTGERIAYLREKKDWSQIELAERMGISNSVLSRIEANKRPVRNDELKKLSELLDTSTDYLSCKIDNPLLFVSHKKNDNSMPEDLAERYIKEVVEKYNIELNDKDERDRFNKLVDIFFGEQNRKK